MSRRLAYVDLDGVICDDRHRVHHALAREWVEYFGLMNKDKPWKQGRELYECLILADFDIQFLTGRREDTRKVTTKWLKKHGFDHELPLHMRATHDRRPLAELKAAKVARALLSHPEVWMFDDDPQVIEHCARVPGATARHCTWHIKPSRLVRRAQS